ncbi:MAG: DMT family transporter [Phycisphaerales bacterium]
MPTPTTPTTPTVPAATPAPTPPTSPTAPITNPHHHSSQLDAILAALFTLAAWTAAPMFVKHFASDIDLWTSNGWRYAFAAACWLPLVLYLIAKNKLPKGIWRKAIIPAIFNSLGQVCFVAALYLIAAGIVTFGLRAHIVFVAIGAAILFPQERRLIKDPRFLIAGATVLLGVCGVLLLGPSATTTPTTTTTATATTAAATIETTTATIPAPTTDPTTLHNALGITLAIAAGLFFACYALSVRKCMTGIGPTTSFGVISLYTAATMLILMLILGDHHGQGAITNLSPTQFFLLLASALIPIALAHVAYYHAISRIGVATVSGIVQLQPFTVSAVSFILFDETLTLGQLAAGAVAVSGATAMLLVQRGHAKLERAEREAAAKTGG